MKKQLLITAFTLITIGFVLIANSVVFAQGNEFTVPLSDPAKRGKLKAHINTGSITVKGSARKDVLVSYTTEDDEDKNKNKEKDGLKRVSGGGMNLEASEISNSVKITSNSNNKVNLNIEVPSGFDLDLSTHNDGDLLITNIQGAVEAQDHNGDITALNISGSVVATSYNGEMKVTFDKVTEGTPMSFNGYNGNIDITLPATTKASCKLKSDQGEIYTGFDMAINSSGPVQKKDTKSGAYKVIIDDWKKGDINGGGPEFTIRTYNGDIYIRKK